jgi:hypothetical protein
MRLLAHVLQTVYCRPNIVKLFVVLGLETIAFTAAIFVVQA